jgi:4-hydroxy-tetrahydrodipicolinate synthase
MSRNQRISGVIPAVRLPRDEAGDVRWDAFDRNVQFLAGFDIAGVCLNGATGEYASATPEERRETVVRARRIIGAFKLVVSAVGSAFWLDTLRLASAAEDAGADLLLIPAPHFFNYGQQDVAEFFRQVVARLRVPALIYNLPAFTGEIQEPVAIDLLRQLAGLAGIKDSSGRLNILQALSHKSELGAVRLVGHDGVLAEALQLGLCDGTISGIAGVLPELTLTLCQSPGDSPRFESARKHLDALLSQLSPLPIPWGLKAIAECRNLAPACYALPLSADRRNQLARFRDWFTPWWETVLRDLQWRQP